MFERSEFGHRAALGDKSSGTIWADAWRPREARVGHMDVPQSEAQGTGDSFIVSGAAPVAHGFGYFCQDKSDPRDSAEAVDLPRASAEALAPAWKLLI